MQLISFHDGRQRCIVFAWWILVDAISELSCSEQHMTGTQPDISVDGLSKHQALLHTKTAVYSHRSSFTLILRQSSAY